MRRDVIDSARAMKLRLYDNVDTAAYGTGGSFFEIEAPIGTDPGDYDREDPYAWIVRPRREAAQHREHYWVAGEFDWGSRELLEPYPSFYRLVLLVYRPCIPVFAGEDWGRRTAGAVREWLEQGFDGYKRPVCSVFRPYSRRLVDPNPRPYEHVAGRPAPGEPPLPSGPPPLPKEERERRERDAERRRKREEHERYKREKARVVRIDT